MGRYFFSLIVAIIVVMGVLGWLVLNNHRYPNDPLVNASLPLSNGTEKGDSGSPSASLKQKRQDEIEKLETADQQELLRVANNRSSNLRVEAILKLMDVQQTPETLVPALAKLLRDQTELVPIAAGIVLHKIGPTGAEHLREMMESDDSGEIAAACTALKEMGGAHLYLPLMRSWLTSTDSEIRKRALFSLQGSNEGVLELLEEITATLEDKDFNVQCMACRVLIRLGPDALDSVPQLLELHKTGNPSARAWSAVALGAIGPNTEFDTAKYLAGTLDEFSHPEKQRSLEGLALMGAEAVSVADQVCEVMNDKSKGVMPEAAFALWRITGETARPLEVLGNGLENSSFLDVSIALVGKMGIAAKPLLGKLIKLLSTAEAGSLESLIVALGNMGPAAVEAVPALKAISEDSESDALIRYYAREAIKAIENKE